ncbi:hypothetical protein [Caudoviricetes sp.]|nr:hypothetical protein [Caudoviricetes sp.]
MQDTDRCSLLLWSNAENRMRIATLDDEQRRGRGLYRENVTGGDWVILLAGSHDDCHAAMRAAESTIQKREAVRRDFFKFEE